MQPGATSLRHARASSRRSIPRPSAARALPERATDSCTESPITVTRGGPPRAGAQTPAARQAAATVVVTAGPIFTARAPAGRSG